MMRMAATLAALCLLSACDLFSSGSTLPPPESTQRLGADRQAAAGLATSRAKARHDADGEALDESRGQSVGSIVPRGQPSAKGPPPAAPADPAPVPAAPAPAALPPS